MKFVGMTDEEVWEYGRIPAICTEQHLVTRREAEKELLQRLGRNA